MPLDALNLLFLIFATASGFVAFTFLPSALEIIKPRDKGPRKILKKPLHQSIRQASRLKSQSKSNQDDWKISKDLEAVLKDAGVKSQRVGRDTVRILGDLELKADLEISENLLVRGSLLVGERCVLHGSAKAYYDLSVRDSVVVKGSLLSKRNVNVGNDVAIAGSVHAEGSVKIGEKSYVALMVVAEGNVELFKNSEAKNIWARGAIKVLPSLQLDLPSSMYRID